MGSEIVQAARFEDYVQVWAPAAPSNGHRRQGALSGAGRRKEAAALRSKLQDPRIVNLTLIAAANARFGSMACCAAPSRPQGRRAGLSLPSFCLSAYGWLCLKLL